MSSKQNVINHLNGLEAAQDNDWLKAVAFFRTIESPSAAIFFNIGCCSLNVKQFSQAEEAFKSCLSKDNFMAVAFYQLAVVQGLLDNLSESVKNFYACCKALRNNAFIDYKQLNMNCTIYKCDALFNIGVVYTFCQDFNLGESYMKEALDAAQSNDKQRFISKALKAIQTHDLSFFKNGLKSLSDSLITIDKKCLFTPSKAMREVVEAGARIEQQSAKVLLADNEEYAFTGFVGPRKLPKTIEEFKRPATPSLSQHPSPVPPPPSKAALKIPPMPTKPPPMPGKPPPMPGKIPIALKKEPPRRPPALKPKPVKVISTQRQHQSPPTSNHQHQSPSGQFKSLNARSMQSNESYPGKVFNHTNKSIRCNILISVDLNESEIFEYNQLIPTLKNKLVHLSEDLSIPLKGIQLQSNNQQNITSRTWNQNYQEAVKNQVCNINMSYLTNTSESNEVDEDIYSDDVIISPEQNFAVPHAVSEDSDEIYSDHLFTECHPDNADFEVYASNVGF